VVGLNGTGDSVRNSPFTRQSLEGMMERQGVNIRGANLNTKNVAAVMVTAKLPAFVAAGTPIDAIQHERERLPVPEAMLGNGEHYVLEVQGDSMIEAGIFDGDTVIIRNGNTANPGDIIVALVDDEEATLKRFRRKGASIALEAANPAYETRIFGPDRVKIQGKLVGLIRRYH